MRLIHTPGKSLSRALHTTLSAAFIAAGLLLALPAWTPAQAQAPGFGVVYQTTNLRSGPGARFEIVVQLAQGDRVSLIGRDEQGAWLWVRTEGGLTGWLPVFALELEGGAAADVLALGVTGAEGIPTSVPGSDVFIESYGRVNVRSGPGMEHEIVAQLEVGVRSPATARSSADSDWLLIVLDETTEGWIAYFTVTVIGDADALPILIPDAQGEGLVPPQALARTLFNIRLHEQPALDSPVVGVIPFGRRVMPLARSASGGWLLVAYDTWEGWGAAGLFDLDEAAFEALPVQGE
ncbi:MAG: SH3 domain-containing protein [Anaerolineae bacterium]|nr:SH3 domain-containing protein [Anaerolineae bacterium]